MKMLVHLVTQDHISQEPLASLIAQLGHMQMILTKNANLALQDAQHVGIAMLVQTAKKALL